MDNEYKKGGSYELPESGSFPARLVSIIEIGTVKTNFYEKGSFKDGEAPVFDETTGFFKDNKGQKVDSEGYRLDAENNKKLKHSHLISLTFEGQNDDKRFYIRTKDITLSLNDRAELRKILESLLGRKVEEGDTARSLLSEALGKACIVEVVHNQVKDKVYANLGKVAQPMKGMTVLEPKASLVFLNFKNFSFETFEKLPEFVQEKIKSSSEYIKMMEPKAEKVDESIKGIADGPVTWTDEEGNDHTTAF